MAKIDLRVRLLGKLTGLRSVATLDDAGLLKAQQQKMKHNLLTDLVFGGIAKGVELTAATAKGESGPIPVRIYRSRATGPIRTADAPPLVINYHGGGWTLGSLEYADWLCSHVCAATGAVVVSVDYRLAPVHRFPAGPEDCYAALVDLVERAPELGADPTRVGVMGDSAGANLSAVVSLMARDRSGPRISHQALLYPAVDLTFSSISSLVTNADAPLLNTADTLAFRDHYLNGQDPKHPHASPLFADDLSGLPPALIQIAEHDPIRDDGENYAAALRDAGVPVRLTEYVGMPHGYLSCPHICRAAPQALAEICAEQRAVFAATAQTPLPSEPRTVDPV